MSCGGYSQTDKGIVIQVCEVSSQQETGAMEGVQVPAVKNMAKVLFALTSHDEVNVDCIMSIEQ